MLPVKIWWGDMPLAEPCHPACAKHGEVCASRKEQSASKEVRRDCILLSSLWLIGKLSITHEKTQPSKLRRINVTVHKLTHRNHRIANSRACSREKHVQLTAWLFKRKIRCACSQAAGCTQDARARRTCSIMELIIKSARSIQPVWQSQFSWNCSSVRCHHCCCSAG
jgi:hypothetical protein